MTLLIGTDEAGYGPNLGPLVVAATIWRVAEYVGDDELYQRLENVVCRSPSARELWRDQLPIADSKQLYKSGAGWGHLERAVLATLGVTGKPVDTWEQIWKAVDPGNPDALPSLPWHSAFQLGLPRDAAAADVDHWQRRLRDELPAQGVELVGLLARAVFPEEFNSQVMALGSKGTLLSRVTLQLVRRSQQAAQGESVLIRCDKHGGRSRYAPLLADVFSENRIEVVSEGRQRSLYRWGPSTERVEICFSQRGETFLPTALASMAAKYLRELAMLAFNHFWLRRVAQLRPTAGYPVDAKRFKAEIAVVQQQLDIADDVLWRTR